MILGNVENENWPSYLAWQHEYDRYIPYYRELRKLAVRNATFEIASGRKGFDVVTHSFAWQVIAVNMEWLVQWRRELYNAFQAHRKRMRVLKRDVRVAEADRARVNYTDSKELETAIQHYRKSSVVPGLPKPLTKYRYQVNGTRVELDKAPEGADQFRLPSKEAAFMAPIPELGEKWKF